MSEVKEESKIPKGTEFTLIVPLDRKKEKMATFFLKEMTEEVYMAAMSLIDRDKDLDATRLIVKSLFLGGDSVDLLTGNLIASMSARKAIRELLMPIDGELKKN